MLRCNDCTPNPGGPWLPTVQRSNQSGYMQKRVRWTGSATRQSNCTALSRERVITVHARWHSAGNLRILFLLMALASSKPAARLPLLFYLNPRRAAQQRLLLATTCCYVLLLPVRVLTWWTNISSPRWSSDWLVRLQPWCLRLTV